MGTVLDYAKRLKEFQNDCVSVVAKYSVIDYELKYQSEYFFTAFEQMFTKLSPFQKGDRCQLNKSFETDKKHHGWYSFQHFLIKGATAVVYSVDWDNQAQTFVYGLLFDNETYEHFQTGELIPVKEKCVFTFSLDWLEKVND